MSRLPLVDAGKARSTPSGSLAADVYNQVVDEQNTGAFYNNDTAYCDGTNNPVQMSAVLGDNRVAGPGRAFGVGSPWTAFTNSSLSSTEYSDGADCRHSCLQVQLTQSSTTFMMDTRGTSARTLTISFAAPCGAMQGCAGPAGSPGVFGGSLTTAGLLSIFLEFPYTSMAVCNSTACREAKSAYAKFWFPDASGRTWRVEWSHLRVLRLSSDAWYIIGDACDGSQVASLSELLGDLTSSNAVSTGYYQIPFLIGLTLKE